MGIVFHGSRVSGLTVISPTVSTHGQAYVYAARQRIVALLFLGSWDDFMLNVAYGDDGILEITERFAGALEQIYENASGFLYELDDSDFSQNRTRFSGEVVSLKTQKVIRSQACCDILHEIDSAGQAGDIRVRRYPDRHPDLPQDDSDLVFDARAFAKLSGNSSPILRCVQLHPHLRNCFSESELTQLLL